MTAMNDREAAPPPEDWEEKARRVLEEAEEAEEAERLRQIEAELEKVKDTVRLAEPDEDLERRMDEIAARAKAARAKPVMNPGGVSKSSAGAYRDAGVALAVAYNVIGCTIGGWGIGALIDMSTGSRPMGQAIGGLIGGVAGITAAIIVVLRSDAKRPKE